MNFVKVVLENINCYDDYLERLQKYLFEIGYIISNDASQKIYINKANYNPLNWNFPLDKKQKPYVLRLFSLEKIDIANNDDCYIKYNPFGLDIFTDKEEIFLSLKAKYKELIYDTNYNSIEEVVVKTLKESSKTIVCAESCTAGMVSAAIVNVAGVSDVFLGGFIVYSNDFKTKFLNVDASLIKKYGAVSEEVVRAMALGCLEYTDADISIAISGIAGPGGSEYKPQGFTYMAIATEENIYVYNYTFKADRNTNRRMASSFILFKLLKDVLNLSF